MKLLVNLTLLITPADFHLHGASEITQANVKFRASFSAMAVSTIDLTS